MKKKYSLVKWGASEIFWVLFLSGILLLAISYGLDLGIKRFWDQGLGFRQSFLSIILLIIQDGILFLLVIFFTIYKKKATFEELGFRRLPFPKVISTAIISLLLSLVLIFFVSLVFYFLHLPGASGRQEPLLPFFDKSLFGFIVVIVVTSIFVPIVEETYFRGFLLQGLTRFLPDSVAIILSSLLFTVLHLNLSIFAPIFILSLVLSIVFFKTRSLWPGIVMHSLKNLGSVIIFYLLGI